MFIFQPAILVWLAQLAYRVSRTEESRKHRSVVLNIFAWLVCVAIATALNIIYGLVRVEPITGLLNFATNFTLCSSSFLLYAANRFLLSPNGEYSTFKEALEVSLFSLLILGMAIFYPLGQGVEMNAATDWSPHWQAGIYIYVMIVYAGGCLVPLAYTSARIYAAVGKRTLKKKWGFYSTGVLGMGSYLCLVFSYNFLRLELMNWVATGMGLLMPLWSYLIYRGLAGPA
jgi:hypothetical protein